MINHILFDCSRNRYNRKGKICQDTDFLFMFLQKETFSCVSCEAKARLPRW